jgi:DNA modification methylase
MEHLGKHLRYWWILCAHHKGGAARLAGKYVIVEWKPLLWYVREHRRPDAEYLVDFVEFGREPGGFKDGHEWQQQEAPARFAIEHLTQPGDVVLDPFLGSGTTLAAAVKLGRRGIGVELDEETLKIARARLGEVGGSE